VQKFIDPKVFDKEKYRVSVVARKDVPNFSPPINTDSIYENDETFKDWLLTKLINAETACYKAEKFKKLNERTRSALLDALYNELHEKNMRVIQSTFNINNTNSNSNSPADSNDSNNLIGSSTSNQLSNNSNHSNNGNTNSIGESNGNLSSRLVEQHQSFGSTLLLNSSTNQIGSTTNLSKKKMSI
jgi:hypothetical protein